jgi:hypothetical protein
MYHKFDVTGNLLFAQYFFFEEVNIAQEKLLSGLYIEETHLHSSACSSTVVTAWSQITAEKTYR